MRHIINCTIPSAAAFLLIVTACASAPPAPIPTAAPTTTSTLASQTPRAMVPLSQDGGGAGSRTSEILVADDLAFPCQQGQLKGVRASGIYLKPEQREYGKTQTGVQCFETEAAAEAAGFRKLMR